MEGVTIRAAQASDYKDIAEIMACPGVVYWTMQLPYISLDQRKQWLEGLTPNDYMLVAEVGGKVVGQIDLSRRRGRGAHTANLGIMVHDDYQDRGIGDSLIHAALDMANNWLNIRRIELLAYTDNARAIHLFQKHSFVIEGTHKAFAFRDGQYVDAYSMARVREL